MIRLSRFYGLALGLLTGCQTLPPPSGEMAPGDGSEILLYDPATVIQDDWLHMQFRGGTDYRLAVAGGRVAIQAVGRNSASGLIRPVEVDLERCPVMAWEWRVEALQQGAGLHEKPTEDVAASIMLLFGNPGSLLAPEPVPTLRYVWTNDRETPGTIIDSPYLPGVVRSLVVRAGAQSLGTWVREERNMLADYTAAFGGPPSDSLWAIALFTDNDQTKEPVMAYYGPARMLCAGGAGVG